MKHLGIDIGKRSCVVCIINDDGTICEETRYYNTLEEADSFAIQVTKRYGLTRL
ncbi:MAG: hypothetical protein ACREA3_07630 [Nitrosotalea sp.]